MDTNKQKKSLPFILHLQWLTINKQSINELYASMEVGVQNGQEIFLNTTTTSSDYFFPQILPWEISLKNVHCVVGRKIHHKFPQNTWLYFHFTSDSEYNIKSNQIKVSVLKPTLSMHPYQTETSTLPLFARFPIWGSQNSAIS